MIYLQTSAYISRFSWRQWYSYLHSSFLSHRHLIIAALHMVTLTVQTLLQVPSEKNWQIMHPIPAPGHILFITVSHSIFSVIKFLSLEINVEFDFLALRFSLNPRYLFAMFWFGFFIVDGSRSSFSWPKITGSSDLCNFNGFDVSSIVFGW